MPLPVGDTPWPPAQLVPALNKMDEWSAWYSGDPEQLSRQYGSYTATAGPRPNAREGGVVGKLVRWFWGTPTAAGQQRSKLHVPVASDISTASADLLFSEAPEITGDDDVAVEARERLDYVLDGNSWESLLLEAAEVDSALGGAFLRVTWDTDLADHPIQSVVHCDAAAPEFAWGRLQAVTFWQVVHRSGQQVWRHLERHEPGRILHGLYQGTEDRLGRVQPLADHPTTAGLTVDAEGGVSTGYPRLTAAYVPNMRPNRLWRNSSLADLGRSDYAGVEPLFDGVDETMTSWLRDVRLAKGRVFVPSQMLDAGAGLGRARTFNLDQEVFTGLNMMLADEAPVSQQLTVQQFAIRAAEHEQTLTALLQQAFRSSGYSASTFGLQDEAGMATATEVNAREKRSLSTREKKTRYWDAALRQHLAALVAVDAAVFGAGAPWEPAVSFPAGAQPSMAELAGSLQMLDAARAISTQTKVELLHPDWTDDERAEEVARILEESKPAPLPDLFGAAPADDPADDPEAPGAVPAELQE